MTNNSRADFETWAKKKGYRLRKDANGSYRDFSTQLAFNGWEAATERAAGIAGDRERWGRTFAEGEMCETIAKAIREG
jgi:hypothetical protein